MAREKEVIEFGVGITGPVLARMQTIAAAGDGWVNLQPAVDPDDVPPRGGIRLFSARGPSVPLCTWAPPSGDGKGPRYLSLGIQHGAAAKAMPTLAHRGVVPDPGWRVLSDSPKRGVVLAVPPDTDPDRALTWLIDAGEALCDLPHRGWRATVHLPRST